MWQLSWQTARSLTASGGFSLVFRMHISNILKDKLFVFSGSNKTTEAENEILSLICEKENLGQIKKSTVIDNEETHDSYRVETSSGHFVFKISLVENKLFDHEFGILKTIEELNLAPKPTATGNVKFGEKIYYLITSFEEGLRPITEYGKSIIYSNYQPILERLKKLHQFQTETTFRDKISEIFVKTDLESQPEFADLIKSNSENYQLINEETLGLKDWIQNNYIESLDQNNLLHFGLSSGTVLLSPRQIKFINFQNACGGNPLIELAAAKFSFDLSQDIEYEIFKCMSDSSWDEYLKIRNFYSGIHLLETTFQYIKEIYLFRGLRQDKILKTFHAFCRNAYLYEHIPCFQKNKEKLAELFSSPMV